MSQYFLSLTFGFSFSFSSVIIIVLCFLSSLTSQENKAKEKQKKSFSFIFGKKKTEKEMLLYSIVITSYIYANIKSFKKDEKFIPIISFAFLCSVLFFSLLLFSKINRIRIKNKKHFFFIPLLNFRNYLFDVMGFSSFIVVYCLWKTLRIIVHFCVCIWCQFSNNTRLHEYT